ncbi:MAG: NosD domain-containing protein [Kiritimatiellia bacterium]
MDRVLVRDGETYAVLAGQSQPLVLDGCVLWSNRKSAVYFGDGVAMEITNSVLEASGPGKYCYESPTNPTIRADYNDLVISSTAQVASINGVQFETVPQWVKLYAQDRYSLNTDPLFHDPATGDVHLRSVEGRYQPGVGWTNDVPHPDLPDFSPLIDMGKPQSAYSNEAAPRGSRINIGLYGNTPLASKSNTNRWVLAVTAMSGGLLYGNVNLVWGYGGGIESNETAWLEYSPRNGADGTWIQIPDEVAVGAGQYLWNSAWALNGVEVYRTSPQARWRLFLRDSTNVLDQTDTYFGLRNNPFKYYVNDESTAGDVFTVMPGSDDNLGFDQDIPKLTVQDLLGSIDIEPTDQVFIDTGTYVLEDTNNPIIWGTGDEGAPGMPIEVFGSPSGTWFEAASDFAPIASDRAFFYMDANYVKMQDVRFRGESLLFRGNGLVTSNLVLTNRASGPPVSLILRGDRASFKNLQIDRGSLTLSGLSNRVERMRQRWGETEIVGTNATLVHSAILTTNANRTGIVVNAAYSVVSNCTVLATRGTAVGKHGAFTLRLGHNILVAGGTNDSNAVIAWTDGDLMSDWNNLQTQNGAWLGIHNGKWEKLAYWQTASGQDANSVSFEPKFQNELTGDLHLNSQGGRWSPIRYAAGLDPWDDTDSETSPLIDLGDERIWAGAESALPWGYQLNLGAYSGTEQASKSLTNFWLTALAYNDGGVVKGSNVVLRWATGNAGASTVALQYTLDGTNWINIATGQPADGDRRYEWDTTGLDGFNVSWRVVAEDGSGVADATDGTFAVRNSPQNFYVNEFELTDDVYCWEPGSSANDGLTPETPKGSLQQILDQYDLEGGDVVYVDTGSYLANADIRVIWSRSGDADADVVIQGNDKNPYDTELIRIGSTNFPAIGIDVKASYFQMRDLTVRGIDRAVRLESNVNVTVQGVVFSQAATGLDALGAHGTEVLNSGFWKTGIGVNLENTRTSVLENLTFARSTIAGIQLQNTVVDVLQNNVFIPGPDAFAYAIGGATSLLAQADMDYNLYDFSATNSGFYAGATNDYPIPEIDPLRPWHLGMARDYRSAVGPAGLADVGEYSWPPDLHPLSANGRWVATAIGGGWTFTDTNTSWAVDHGNPYSDFSLEPDVNGGRINVGMYGNTAQASQGDNSVDYEIRSLNDEGIVLQGLDLSWPMVWSAHLVDIDEMASVWFSGDGGTNWTLLATVPAYQEYYLWQAGIESQTANGLWRVTGDSGADVSDNPFIFIPIDFRITRSPYSVSGLMRFDWQGGLPGRRYQIRYSDDFGQTWILWEAKYNGPAAINMSDFFISVTSTNYIFEDRTSYLKRTRWYRIDPYEEP